MGGEFKFKQNDSDLVPLIEVSLDGTILLKGEKSTDAQAIGLALHSFGFCVRTGFDDLRAALKDTADALVVAHRHKGYRFATPREANDYLLKVRGAVTRVLALGISIEGIDQDNQI